MGLRNPEAARFSLAFSELINGLMELPGDGQIIVAKAGRAIPEWLVAGGVAGALLRHVPSWLAQERE